MSVRRKIIEMPKVLPLEDSVLLLEVARSLVDHPAEVKVHREDNPTYKTLTLTLDVLPADRGRVIGRKGRTISAIRNLFSAIGLMDGRRVLIKLRED